MDNKNTTPNYNIEDFKLNYRACIPLYVLLDSRLSKNEIKLYGLIEQMESSMNDVFINDRSLCHILDISFEARNLGKMQKRLKSFGYIKREKREITVNNNTFMASCWNTVKVSMMINNTSTPVAEKPTPSVAQQPTYNTHDLNTHDLNFLEPKPEKQKTCAQLLNTETNYKKQELTGLDNLTYERRIAHTIKICAQDEECKTEFEAKFGAYDITYQRMLEECTSHYTTQAKLFDKFKFLDWIRNTDPQRKGYKTKLQTKKESSFTYANLNKKQIELVQNLHWEKMNPDLDPKLKSLERIEALRLVALLDAANETIPYEVYSEEEKKTVNLMNGQAARLIIGEVLKQSPSKISDANRMALLGSIGRKIN